MFLGLISVSAIAVILFIVILRGIGILYTGEIAPYRNRGERPPLFDFRTTDEDEDICETHKEHVDRKVKEWREDLLIQHQQFLRTKLGRKYLVLVKEFLK